MLTIRRLLHITDAEISPNFKHYFLQRHYLIHAHENAFGKLGICSEHYPPACVFNTYITTQLLAKKCWNI